MHTFGYRHGLRGWLVPELVAVGIGDRSAVGRGTQACSVGVGMRARYH